MYEIFAKLMEQHGVTSYRVSQETGISQATLSEWKHGRSTPKLPKLQILAEYFDVPLAYLMGAPEEAIPKSDKAPSDDEIKKALFGDIEVTDRVFEEIKAYARMVAQREQENKEE